MHASYTICLVLASLAAAHGSLMAFDCVAHLVQHTDAVNSHGKLVIQAAGASLPLKLYKDAMFAYEFQEPDTIFEYTVTGSGECV